jgi:hypothetical protein
MAIAIEGGFDGANPQDPGAIEQLGEASFLVHPFSEDGDGNYKFALNVRANNPADAAQPLHLEVDWADAEYMADRNFIHVGSGFRWAFQPAQVSGTRTIVDIVLPPGTSYIGLCPAYNLNDFLALSEMLVRFGYARQVAGQSEQGREIATFRLGNGPAPVLLTARFHPYETAASYCIAGLMRWLGQPFREQEALLKRYTFTILPMPNPDGVYLGLCKRTAIGGVDLPHEGADGKDATARALLGLITSLRPAAWLDLHGWMHADEDGIDCHDQGLGERFRSAVCSPATRTVQGKPVPPDSAQERSWSAFAGNKWKLNLASGDPRPGSLHDYAFSQFGTAWLAVSYRWPGRTAQQMGALGGPTLQAFCAAL